MSENRHTSLGLSKVMRSNGGSLSRQALPKGCGWQQHTEHESYYEHKIWAHLIALQKSGKCRFEYTSLTRGCGALTTNCSRTQTATFANNLVSTEYAVTRFLAHGAAVTSRVRIGSASHGKDERGRAERAVVREGSELTSDSHLPIKMCSH